MTTLCDLHAGHVCGQWRNHNIASEGFLHGRTLSAAHITDTTREAYRREKAYLFSRAQKYHFVLMCSPNDLNVLRHW